MTRHECGPSCFCRVHLFTLYFAPENEPLPESGEHACPDMRCPVWHAGDKGVILANEAAGYVCNCDPEEIRSGDGFGYGFRPEILQIVHHPACRLLDPPCFVCFGYGIGRERPGEVMGTAFRCPGHEIAYTRIPERFKGAIVPVPPGRKPIEFRDIGPYPGAQL